MFDYKNIKRIIGLPKEQIRIENGFVYINDSKLDEKYVYKDGVTVTYNDYFWRNYLIPDNQYFVMGDNREHSDDSRNYGPIKREEIFAILE